MLEYNKICEELLGPLSERTKTIITRRFGLFGNERETLEFIGKEHKITRERVRQVERDGIKQVKKRLGEYEDVFSFFNKELEGFGGLKKEDLFVDNFLEEGACRNCIVFLLTVSDNIVRFSENDETYSLWAKNKEVVEKAKEVIDEVFSQLKNERKLRRIGELKTDVDEITLKSYLEISKRVISNSEGLYGLYSWPEINPKGIKDRAYLVLKKKGVPLHFRDVAIALGEKANPQTTHNELIKDSRFVLVGRGVYALSEWGYVPGEVKEVIRGILEKEGALAKSEIILKVEEQRIVKKNTIIQNLSNKKYFIRTPDGKYTVA
jgi:hypothetical protein